MFFKKARSKQPQLSGIKKPEAPVADDSSQNLNATKSDLDRLYQQLKTVVPQLQHHLQDSAIHTEPDLVSMLHRLWATARDSRDGMRAIRERHGVRT